MTKSEIYFKWVEDIDAKALEISKAKNKDYTGDEDDPFGNFKAVEELGISVEHGFLTRMMDKMKRVSNLIDSEAAVKDESIEDTLLDLANYARLFLGYLQLEKKDTWSDHLPRHTGPGLFEFLPDEKELLPWDQEFRDGWGIMNYNINTNSDLIRVPRSEENPISYISNETERSITFEYGADHMTIPPGSGATFIKLWEDNIIVESDPNGLFIYEDLLNLLKKGVITEIPGNAYGGSLFQALYRKGFKVEYDEGDDMTRFTKI